ncbi:MAG: hypothetical protein AAB434_13485 [Planctomycetota bacterium]
MRRVHGLAFLLFAVIWSQVPGSGAPIRQTRAWAPFIRAAETYGFPVTYLRGVAEETTMGFGDQGEVLARYADGSVLLDASFRDVRTGTLLPMERLWVKPGTVGAVYHELFHAFFEREIATNPGELERFQQRAGAVFRDVPMEKRLEVAEEAVGCWIASLVETATAVVRRDREGRARGWPRVADWNEQDRQALANGYEVHFRPEANVFGYYQDGGEIVHTEVGMDEWFIEFAWTRVLQGELPRTFEEFLAQRS